MLGNSSSSYFNLMNKCNKSQTVSFLSTVFLLSKFVTVVPISVLVLTLGFRRWQRQRSFRTISHTDIFTYNAAALGLVFGLAAILYCCGLYTHVSWVLLVGYFTSSIVFPGEIFLHIMTCVERYLAVVHPVVYLGLRRTSAIRIRNTSIGCVWLISFGWLGVIAYFHPALPVVAYFCLLTTSFVIVSFCSLSVLCFLIRQGPGDVGGLREWADKSRKKAFCTITAILSVLVVYFLAAIFMLAVQNFDLLDEREGCLALMCAQWCSFPSHLVLLLLFLQRAKELQSCSEKMKQFCCCKRA